MGDKQGKSLEEREIINLVKKSNKPLSFLQIAKKLGVDKKDRKQLKKVLKKLKKEGKLSVDRGKFRIADKEEVVTGKVLPYPAGFGFLEVEGRDKDIYIPPFEMKRLMGGDRVKAKVVEFKGKNEVRIERILNRAKKELIGKIERRKKRCYFYPLDENSHLSFLAKGCEELKNGTLVVAQVVNYPSKRTRGSVKIKDVLGDPQEKFLAMELLIRKYNLPVDYPSEVMEEVKSIPDKIPDEEIKRRKDLRKQLCFTIDPEKAKDFDDAVAVEITPEGKYRLFVHIADVSFYVREGSKLDEEAYKRGFTFYFPDRAIHMLPEKLSAELCSLRPLEDKLAFTCEMLFDEKGKLVDYDIYESVIRSKARLTYKEALALIVGDPALEDRYPELVTPLRNMELLYRILSRRRWEQGSIDFDLPEAEVIMDEYGEPTAVLPYERHVAHRIIEHFMVSANETVAMHLENLLFPCIYRVHEPPDPDKVDNLLEILGGLGYKVRKPNRFTPKFFQKIIEDFEGKPEEHLVRFLTLRAMKRARYSPVNLGHFGLASEHYAHFTSPIRRYPDLILHRLLKKALSGSLEDFEGMLSYLDTASEYMSERERLADQVEREAIDIMKARYMKSRVGEDFEGIITGVVPFGIFVEVKEILVEGLVRINLLKDDDYMFDEPAHRLVGVRSGKVYRLGDTVRVRVLSVDEERGKIEMSLVDDSESS